jgi:hypothetical protein
MRKQCDQCSKSYVDKHALDIHKNTAHDPNKINLKERLTSTPSPKIKMANNNTDEVNKFPCSYPNSMGEALQPQNFIMASYQYNS